MILTDLDFKYFLGELSGPDKRQKDNLVQKTNLEAGLSQRAIKMIQGQNDLAKHAKNLGHCQRKIVLLVKY